MSAAHLISIEDVDSETLRGLVERARSHAAGTAEPWRGATGRIVATYFKITSTRTRTAFSTAALRLGAHLIAYGPNDLQEKTGESIGDTARVLSGMLDALVIRTGADARELRELADQRSMSVINAMSLQEHPTQAITDGSTIAERFGTCDGIRLLYVGEGNSTAASLCLALTRFPGVQLDFRTPPGFGLSDEVTSAGRTSADRSGATLSERHDVEDLPDAVDVVYTTRWQTTGTSKPDPDWRTLFAPFRASIELMARYPDARFMHDLPAHRGEEVDAAVLDGPQSIAFRQAQHKMFGALAVLEWALGRGR